MRGHRRERPGPVRVTLSEIRVRAMVGDRRRGQLLVGPAVIPCALGAGGIVCDKREGDGGSPRGRFRLRGGAYRPDHLGLRPSTALPLRATRPDDGWCDESRDRRYNRPIRLPAPGVSAEAM
ncbi:L,D-transpeptidase catalytic domain protein, partial [Methylobacterium sp. ARG-1]